jgi:site-specific recombinase XerD
MANKDHKFIQPWLQFVKNEGTSAFNTLKTYRIAIRQWIDWYHSKENAFDVREANKHDIRSYRDYMKNIGRRTNTIALKLKVVELFYDWMELVDHIENNPFPSIISKKGDVDAKRILVLEPSSIFKIRKLWHSKFKLALPFELLLSSGLRVSEFLALRACDIDFDEHPIDLSTGKISEYTGGAIHIDTRVHIAKSNKSRTTYISKIAARILQQYMDVHGIREGSNIPIFPYDVSSIGRYMCEVSATYIEKKREEVAHLRPRSTRHTDIDLNEHEGLSEEMRKKIAKMQASTVHSSKDDNIGETTRRHEQVTSGAVVRDLHAHALRHTFACNMYHRNYHGDRHSEMRIIKMLGHSIVTTTLKYLTKLDLISSDDQWRRIMLGRPTDWIGLE